MLVEPAGDPSSVVGELDRVPDQVQHHPLEVAAVAEHEHGLVRDLEPDVQPAADDHRPEGLVRAGEHRAQVDGRLLEDERAGLDPREREQVLDQHDQALAVAAAASTSRCWSGDTAPATPSWSISV